MTGPALPTPFLQKVAQTAADRSQGWEALADVLSPPDAALVERLRSGALTQAWRQGSSWLGEDTHMQTAELMSLDVYARAAARRSPEDDLADLTAGYDALVADSAGLVPSVRALASLCRDEARAWTDGDPTSAKAVRVAQQGFVEERLLPGLPELAGRLARDADANIWRVLGRLTLAILSADTGKDFQRAVLGKDLGRQRRRVRDQ